MRPTPTWILSARDFFRSLQSQSHNGAFSSVAGKPETLYGTCYSLLGQYYLGVDDLPLKKSLDYILKWQNPSTGLIEGPELAEYQPHPSTLHDREHLSFHLTCTAIATCLHFNTPPKHKLKFSHKFCDRKYLWTWLEQRDLKNAWFEGNNILFIGQLLVTLRDLEGRPDANEALKTWFAWLDSNLDPNTSIWGTNGYCSNMEAVYGGYHQLLVYFHEDHALVNERGLIDTVLSLQHSDGGFHPDGNAGACEDVDCVDILVNLYKRSDYRRADIRAALRQCADHILSTQNTDGGFPYNRNRPQSHMGIPWTSANPNQSTAFATWFRVHTLALISQILVDEPELKYPLRFTNVLSMGWHRPTSPLEIPIFSRKDEIPYNNHLRKLKTINTIKMPFLFLKRKYHGLNRRLKAFLERKD